jgi:hypothetical protein
MLVPLLLLLQVPAQTTLAPPPGAVYHGFRQELEVTVPRFDAEVRIDGVLDEGVWAGAAVLTGFSQYSPSDGVTAADSTEVLVWYSDQAIYFGIRAFEPHVPVSPRLSDRDRIGNDDHVQILLDTFHDGRRAYVFGVNPLGVQSDGIRTEAQSGAQQGLMSTRTSDPVDLSPDFIYESRGRITTYGYEVEIRIPFQSLRFRNLEEQRWGIQVIRRVQHSGQTQTWTPARLGRASFLAQSGTLRGMEGIEGRQVLDFSPVATARLEGGPGPDGYRYGSATPELGATARWGVTPNLTLNATANPDFSQVEADAGQLSFDPRRALFFAEKRPFFLEGSERFQAPNRLIHTRRIVSPDGALKLTGKISRWDVGLLTAVDGRSASPQDERALAQIVRVQRDLGEESTVGLLLTDRREEGYSNQVVGADTRVNFASVYSLAAQVATSATEFESEREWGSLWDVNLRRRSRAVSMDVGFQALSPTFEAANGFLSRVDLVQARFSLGHTRFGAPEALVESWTRGITLSGNWLREGFFGSGRHIEDWKFHLNSNALLGGGWGVGASILIEEFYFPPYLYEGYAIERRTGTAVDTIPFVGTPSIMNYDLVVRLSTPRSPRFSGNLLYIVGRDENFDEWAPAWIQIVSSGLEWRPNDQFRIEPTWLLQQYVRPDDRSTVSLRNVPRLKVEFQATRAIFFRAVGQYQAFYRDALRDDTRTNDPLLIRNPATGVYEPALELRRNDFHFDWLFSFRPSPGTVVFAGYGAGLREPDAFRFRDLERASDQFFVKLSWLFRM